MRLFAKEEIIITIIIVEMKRNFACINLKIETPDTCCSNWRTFYLSFFCRRRIHKNAHCVPCTDCTWFASVKMCHSYDVVHNNNKYDGNNNKFIQNL